jgi:hypothetical protein
MGDAWLTGLLDDTAFAGAERTTLPGQPDRPGTDHAALIGSLVIRDDRLAAVDRALQIAEPIPCRVINTGGAGGLLPLANREFDHLRPTSVRSGLRDLDDLAGAAARVAVAARDLDPDLTVLIELPAAPGWRRAVDTAELEGLSAAVADRTDRAGMTDQLGALIEADVPFVITGPVGSADRVIELIMTVLALIDGTAPEDAPAGPPTPEQGARIRRRLLGIEVESVSELITTLDSRGWLGHG